MRCVEVDAWQSGCKGVAIQDRGDVDLDSGACSREMKQRFAKRTVAGERDARLLSRELWYRAQARFRYNR